MNIIAAKDFKPGSMAFLWEETGDGSLRKVSYIRSDWWIVTGHCSWCCTPDTYLYEFDNDADMIDAQKRFRAELAERRANWSKGVYA